MRPSARPRVRNRAVVCFALLALVALAQAAGDPAMQMHGLQSPDLAPGASWQLAFSAAGNEHYHCHQHPAMLGMVQVVEGAPMAASVRIVDDAFVPEIVQVAPGGTVTWTNGGNATHSVALDMEMAAVTSVPHISGFVAAFLWSSAALSVLLVAFAVRAYRRGRNPDMAFVASAFVLFMLKDALVAYSLQSGLIPHETLELVDAAGDLGTVLLLVLPLFWSTRRNAA